MKLSRLAVLVLALSLGCNSLFAFDMFGVKRSSFGLQITNPVSGSSKMGGVMEIRAGLNSLNFGLIMYTGVYEGTQYRLEYQRYWSTRKRNEYYWYVKAYSGDASYDSKKLESFGEKSGVVLPPCDYFGAGIGVGRRINFKYFNITGNLGLKYTNVDFTDLVPSEVQHYNLFYVTGPGSILDANIRFGFQL